MGYSVSEKDVNAQLVAYGLPQMDKVPSGFKPLIMPVGGTLGANIDGIYSSNFLHTSLYLVFCKYMCGAEMPGQSVDGPPASEGRHTALRWINPCAKNPSFFGEKKKEILGTKQANPSDENLFLFSLFCCL